VKKQRRVITSLWGGNGVAERCEVRAENGERTACVAKRIQFPKDSSVDARRKRKSYRNELAFYRTVAPDLLGDDVCAVPRPVELLAEKDAITLVLVDVSAEYPVALEELSATQLRTALQWLARFHARYWERPDLHRGLAKRGSYWFLETRPDELKRIDTRRYKRLLRCAPALDARLNGVVHERGQRRYSPSFLTLVHGDYKPANLQFTRDGSRCVAYDFQYTGRGYGALDLCYLLYPDTVNQDGMLRHYHRALCAALEPAQSAPSFQQLTELVELSFLDFFRFLLGWYYDRRRPPAALEQAATRILSRIDGGELLSVKGYQEAVARAYPLHGLEPRVT